MEEKCKYVNYELIYFKNIIFKDFILVLFKKKLYVDLNFYVKCFVFVLDFMCMI